MDPKSLEKNNMPAFFAENKEDALKIILDMVPEGASIGMGGSKTIVAIGVFDALKKKNCKILDWVHAESNEEKKKLRIDNFGADFYFSSTNAPLCAERPILLFPPVTNYKTIGWFATSSSF